jgi:hypothetical protein
MTKTTKKNQGYLQELSDLIERTKAPPKQKETLLNNHDMIRAWREIERVKIKPLALLNYIHQAHDDAIKEMQRPALKEEGLRLDAVRLDLKRLKLSIQKAIEVGALPANTGWPIELQRVDMPPVVLTFGFGGMNKKADWIGYPLDLTETIETALAILEGYRHGLPDRAIERKKGKRNPAFVRLLVLKLRALHGVTLPATVAAIANAIDDPADPWDGPAVVSASKGLPMPVPAKAMGSMRKKPTR